MQYLIIEHKRVKPLVLHVVSVIGTPLEIANQTRSLTTFKNRYGGGYGNMDRWFLVKNYEEYFAEREKKEAYLRGQLPLVSDDDLLLEHNDVILLDCVFYNSLWEFYTNIKYDHKKKIINVG